MRRLALRCLAVFLLVTMSCSHETTEWCADACAIFRDCTGWDFETCMGECRAEGDWDAEYLACLRSQPCHSLEACG